SSCSSTACGRISTHATFGSRSRSTRSAAVASAVGERRRDGAQDRSLSNAVSRVLVAVAAIPIVVGAVYFGGWWLFALVTVAAVIGLHEFWLMTKPLAPLAPAGYIGAVLALVGAEQGGIEWMVGGMLTALPIAFLLKGISATRQAPTASISATVMGTLWVGCGLAFVLLLGDLPEKGRLAALTVVIAVWAGDTLAYLGGRVFGRHRMAPTTSPGKTWEGFAFGTAATIFVAFVALYKQHFL